jgi:hypothetical protein
MPTILDLFKEQKKDLYGKSENIRIESRGLINPPRGAALLASSPTKLGDLIGNQIAGAIGGSANRPSDTIFKGKSFLSKPISLFKTPGALRNAVDAGTEYFIKPEPPSPNSIIATIKQGASSPAATVANLAINAIKGLKDKNPSRGLPYGQKYQSTDAGKTILETTKFSTHFTFYNDSKEALDKVIGTVVKRDPQQKKTWDNANDTILKTESLTQTQLVELQKEYELQNQVWITFQKYGNNEIVPFVGTLTGISEDVTPEWTNFRYLGSPFKSYRYLGVERTLNFELKLYYKEVLEKQVMIKKINYLKSLAFPYDTISQIQYKKDMGTKNMEPVTLKQINSNSDSTTTSESTQYAFSPNLIYLSMGDMYKNLFGFIETLSFTIDENTTWTNLNYNMEDGKSNELYPSVVSVSIGMKIIEQHLETKGTVTKYKYDFDGRKEDSIQEPKPTGTGNAIAQPRGVAQMTQLGT